MRHLLRVKGGKTLEFGRLIGARLRVSPDGTRYELVVEAVEGDDTLSTTHVVRSYPMQAPLGAVLALASLDAMIRQHNEQARVWTLDDYGLLTAEDALLKTPE